MKAPHITGDYARYRIRDPSQFERMRIKDIGRKGHSKAILGKMKGKNEWKIQAILVAIADYRRGARVIMRDGRPVIKE